MEKIKTPKRLLLLTVIALMLFTGISGYLWHYSLNAQQDKYTTADTLEKLDQTKEIMKFFVSTAGELLKSSWVLEKEELKTKMKSKISYISNLITELKSQESSEKKLDNNIWSILPDTDPNFYFYTISLTDKKITLPEYIKKNIRISAYSKKLEMSQIDEIIRLASHEPAGFYLNLNYLKSIPNFSDSHFFTYNSYAKYFPEYDLVLGVTVQKNIIENNVFQVIEHSLEKLKHNNKYKLFIYTQNGLCLLHSDKTKIGKNLYNYTDQNGFKINKFLISQSTKQSGSFFKYLKPLPGTALNSEVMAYGEHVPGINCIIGCEFNLSELKNKYQHFSSNDLSKFNSSHIVNIFFLSGILAISIFFIYNIRKFFAAESQTAVNNAIKTALAVKQATDIAEKDSEAATHNNTHNLILNMSHELRTPLNIIIGLQQIMFNSDISSRERNYITKSHYTASSLLKIIDNIIEYYKLDSNFMSSNGTEVCLECLIKDLFNNIYYDTNEKKINMTVELAANLPKTIMIDQGILLHILTNILYVSLKSTFKGDITLTVNIQEQSGGNLVLLFTVKDTGIGTPSTDQDSIFLPPAKNTTPSISDYNDIILNIIVCRRLITLLNGNFSINSRTNYGSTFTFSLPTQLCEKKAPPAPLEKPCNIFIVSNHIPTIKVLKKYLLPLNITPIVCLSIEQIMNQLTHESTLESDKDCILLLDNNIDNFNISEEDITKILKLTDMRIHLIEIIPQIKFNLHITSPFNAKSTVLGKPVLPSALYSCINEVLSNSVAGELAQQQTQQKNLNPANILLVEDNPINKEITKVLLENLGCNVSTANNGSTAVSMAKNNKYDIILMDIQMPEMDGITATKKIRKFDTDLPIIALTAHTINKNRDNFINAGLTDHIIKPLKIDNITRILCKYTESDIIIYTQDNNPPLPEAVTPSTIDSVTGLCKSINGLNYEEGLENTGNDQEIYLQLLKDFAEYAQETITEMAAAIDDDNLEELSRTCHSLKGSSSSMGFTNLYNAAVMTESKLKNKKTRTVSATEIADLTSILQETADDLNAKLPLPESI